MTAVPDHDELRRKLAWKGPPATEGRFLSVFMDQNNKCNLTCRMCGFSDARVGGVAKYDMPRWLFDSIAFQIFPHTNYLCLSILTEPFMTRDFPDRLDLVRQLGVPFSDIITNGTLLTEQAIAKVIAAGITRLTFSIDGGTKEVFESIRTGARFEQVMRNLWLFLAMRKSGGPRLRINHVLSEPNIDHFDDFLGLMAAVHPDEIAVRTVSRMSDAVIQESRNERFWDKVRDAREKLAEFSARTGIEHTGYLRDRPTRIDLFSDAGDVLSCRAPWENFAIHPNGDVYPCMAWTRPPAGNLARETFAQIWEGEAMNELRREYEETQPGVDCLNCTIRLRDDDDDFFYEKVAKPLALAADS